MGEFDGAGSNPGLEVWRVEKMVPTPVPAKMVGQFFEGDAYIVLKTTQKPGSVALEWNIHFWLGTECSQDEQGIAAYKTVELDEQLGGAAVQHREVQGEESDMFMQNFKKVEYLKGGVASGFVHVERDVYEPRLLHLKGARSVRVRTVPLSAASLNSGDVFILDLGLRLIQWNGAEANRKEKAKALEVCAGIKDDERKGKASIDACEQGSESPAFWEGLGGKGPVAPATEDSDPKVEKGTCTLYKVSDASGAVSTTQVASGELNRDMLDTNDVFVMDNVATIFIWVGKNASPEERKSGMKVGDDYCSKAGRPKSTRVCKVMEGCEPTLFKSNFASWSVAVAPVDFSLTPRGGNVAGSAPEKRASLLGREMAETTRRQKEMQAAIDDGNGSITVLRIEGFETVEVDESLHGKFYAGDSYIVKYTYEKDGKELHILYYWLGRTSTTDEKGAAALHVTKMDDMLGGAATQVRVVMGKEPEHFVRCFKGRMVVHSGGKASGFKNRADADTYDMDGISLFQVQGWDVDDTRAVQVVEKAGSLNSGDTFVLQTPTTVYGWTGSGANDVESTTAKKVAESMQATRAFEAVAEGAEPEAFWEALGGKGEYPKARVLSEGSREPMLFSCSNATGSLVIEPIYDFAQSDLLEEDVFLLDCYTTIFLWLGSEANAAEKSGAQQAASAYIQANAYAADTPITSVKSGAEPGMFTCHFLGWDATPKKKFVDPYEAKLAALKAANPPEPEPESAPVPSAPTPVAATATKPDVSDPEPAPAKRPSIHEQTFSEGVAGGYTLNYETLKKPPEELPKGVDPRKREQYLSDAEFMQVLGSPRGDFEKLKPWKQSQLKKAAGIF